MLKSFPRRIKYDVIKSSLGPTIKSETANIAKTTKDGATQIADYFIIFWISRIYRHEVALVVANN